MRTILCQLKVRLLVGLKISPLRIYIMDICHTRIEPPRWQIVSERSLQRSLRLAGRMARTRLVLALAVLAAHATLLASKRALGDLNDRISKLLMD